MKLIKSLLLGSAAGLMAVTGSMAADLPSRKAAPVDYVRTCPGQGVGFFFIPGTENCLQISGRARADYLLGRKYSVADDTYGIVASSSLRLDYRQNTSIGIVRAYVRLNMSNTSGRSAFGYTGTGVRQTSTGNVTATMAQAFIQFGLGGGIVTVGRAPTFFDDYGNFGGYQLGSISGTQGSEVNLLAYTANFGGGFTATVAIEDRGVNDQTTTAATALLGNTQTLYNGRQYPDLVASLRLQQAWGSAQLMGALRNVKVSDEGTTTTGVFTPGGFSKNLTGYAIGAGVNFNLPTLGAGSGVYLEGVYTKGMTGYVGLGSSIRVGYANVAVADFASDFAGVAGTASATSANLATAFSLVAALRVQYTPVLRQNIFLGYTDVSYGTLGNGAGVGGSLPLLTGLLNTATGLRSFKKFEVGTNFQYTMAPGLNLGVEVVYVSLDPSGAFNYTSSTSALNAAVANNQSAVEGRFRIQRDF